MGKKNLSMISSAILVVLSIADKFQSIELNIVIGIVSIFVVIFALMYSLYYKNIYDKIPIGFGLIALGSGINIIWGLFFDSFNSIGSLIVLVGLIIAFINKDK